MLRCINKVKFIKNFSKDWDMLKQSINNQWQHKMVANIAARSAIAFINSRRSKRISK